MTRFVPLVVVVCLGASGVARADDTTTGTLPNGNALTWTPVGDLGLLIPEGGGPLQTPSTPNAFKRYLDFAHCECSQMGLGKEQTFQQKLQATFGASLDRPIDIWVGTSCAADVTTRNNMCRQLPGLGFSSFNNLSAQTPEPVEVSIHDLMTPVPTTAGGSPDCTQSIQGTDTLWAIMDSDGNGDLDYFVPITYNVDTQPPPIPTGFVAQSSESGIHIAWDAPGDVSDIWYYQALCAGPDGLPVRSGQALCTGSQFDDTTQCARWVRAKDLCGLEEQILMPVDVSSDGDPGGADAGTATPPHDLLTLDPTFLCGQQADKTATSLDIGGLANGTPYSVAVVVIDLSGNVAGVVFNQSITPRPVTDLWEDLHNNGSKAEGGLCLLETTFGDDNPLTNAMRAFRDQTLASTAFGRWLTDVYYGTIGKIQVHAWPLRILAAVLLLPLVAIALVWHVLTLPGLLALVAVLWLVRKRRLPKRALAAAATLGVLLLPGHARADGITPYWAEESVAADEDTSTGPIGVTWIAGIRLGPYTPQIDSQLGQNPGPYKRMFGSAAAVMPQFDLDRILWHGYGTFGVGLSVGYMAKKAHSFVTDSMGNTTDARSPGDTTAFRMIPLAVTALYRYTVLDDDYGIPIVPYARAGLAYDVWWISKSGGDGTHFSTVCKDPSGIEPSCEQNKALGASLGVVGSIGINIRAERVDATAATSMRQSGIEHAGFYAELSFAKVDGFGSSTKLSVGDTTWFAGVNFEF